MPPKQAASKKAITKEKAKIIEDKTFGLKNKNKSKKVEQYIKSVTATVNNRGGQDKRAEELARQKKEDKERAAAAKREVELLFGPVITQPKLPVGVDPKSVVCELFKHKQCTKGDKCKYSHDLSVGRRTQKIDLHSDKRTKEEDIFEEWDQEKLESAVAQKQGSTNKNLPTKIVCKYFLDAIEQQKYGWFWECPNGGDKCQYVHALPPGFVLKSKKTEPEEEDEPTPIEELIEEQRKLIETHTPVTKENFLKWKEEKRRKREEAAKAEEAKKQADIKSGKRLMSGRDLFVFNPDMFVDDDAAIDIDDEELGENPDEYAIPTTTTTTTTNEDEASNDVDALAVEVNESLFVDDDIPDEDDE